MSHTVERQPDVLFLWVPKCAGTSIYRTLVKYGCPEERWEDPGRPFHNDGIVTFGHVGVLHLLDAGVVSQGYFDRAFKFAFTRNPFDRLVSLFVYLKRIKADGMTDETTFETFCHRIDAGDVPPVGLYNYRSLNQCNPMVRWLTHADGRLIPDFIGRYENLEQDFQAVCRQIGVRDVIAHENRSDHRPYREYYDTRTRAIVERVYREDLERFDYVY